MLFRPMVLSVLAVHLLSRGFMQCTTCAAGEAALQCQPQEELAERIERTPAFIGHVETPNINKAVSLDTLFAIAEVLEVPAYRFLIFEE